MLEELQSLGGCRGWEDGCGVWSDPVCVCGCGCCGGVEVAVPAYEFAGRCGGGEERGPNCVVRWGGVGGGEGEEGCVPAGERGGWLVAEDEGLQGRGAVREGGREGRWRL